ncbi:hypothetical protein MBLNU13_g09528t1 [Cladosporium sp. NU13]
MSATLLANELSNLISEAKRKQSDLRHAAEKSLQEIKSLSVTSEQQLAADLSRRSDFVEPFLLACATRIPKLAGTGVTCLQRLVVSQGLAKSRLGEAVEAFHACTDLGFDIQLKVLQALPSLVQNYSDDLKGDLLSGTLQVCSSLQAAKVQTVSGVAAATLQQLVTTVFERVAAEDLRSQEIPPVAEIPGPDGPIPIRPAAYDAYRIFRDLVLAVEDRKAKFVDLTSLSREASLELVFSCIDANPSLISKHAEFSSIVRANVMPFVTQALSERPNFPVTLRCARVVNLILTRHFAEFAEESEIVLGLLTHGLEADSSQSWKRSLYLEVLRNFFDDSNLVITATMAFDAATGGKPVIQNIMSAFVRLSTEKPAIIGLGQQSTIPVGPASSRDQVSEQLAMEAAGGMAGVISSAFGATESSVPGISSEWSIPRTACIDQLDKSEPPTLPDTYAYSLVLECLNSLSDNLAKVVLPYSVQHERSKNKGARQNRSSQNGDTQQNRSERSQSFRKRAVPLNPLDIEGPSQARIKAVASLIESCWPAVLATSSTFLNAALDDHYYRSLIKAYQRFAQVAGLLRLSTPRDALMTTLGKAAVPPHVLSASTAEPMRSPSIESPRVFSNPRHLLSVDSFVSQNSTASTERDRRASVDPDRPTLTIRNLLCLRALLNLAIALGPTLGPAFRLVIDVLKQADMVLSAAAPHQASRQGSGSYSAEESPSALHAFSSEVAAVEAAASRLLESTADYPNDAFVNIVETFCRLLRGRMPTAVMSPKAEDFSPPSTPTSQRRKVSGLPGLSTLAEMQARDYQFILPKLGNLAALNVSRFVTNKPEESGWDLIVEETLKVAVASSSPPLARRAATDLLCKLCAACLAEVVEEEQDLRATIQRRVLTILPRIVEGIYAEDGELTSADIEVQVQVLDAVKNILERSGESLVAGWNRVLALISSVFDSENAFTIADQHSATSIDWSQVSHEFMATRLGREAFTAVQLICSDFLGLLPIDVVPALIELLHRFMGQRDDLNLSLTTITMTWNLSDTLFDEEHASALEAMNICTIDLPQIETKLRESVDGNRAAQWLLVLVRLRDIVRSGQKEARKAAFQIVCSICKNHGAQLSAGSWNVLFHTVVVGILCDNAAAVSTSAVKPVSEDNVQTAHEMTEIILEGTSAVLAQHARVIEHIAELPQLWDMFANTLEVLLSNGNYSTSAAIYRSLTTILATVDVPLHKWQRPVQRTFVLWSSKIPPVPRQQNTQPDNQTAFVAYADLASDSYRLMSQELTEEQAATIIDNLFACVRESKASYYGADIHAMSPLQDKVLNLLQSLRTDIPGSKPRLVTTAAAAILLHTETAHQDNKSGRPSYIALAGESIDWLQRLITTHAQDPELRGTDAVQKAVESLQIVISRKYGTKQDYKGMMLWRRATAAAIAVAQPVLEKTLSSAVSKAASTALWTEFVRISGAIVTANDLHTSGDVQRIYEDQVSDIAAYEALRQIMVPRLGSSELPDSVRATFAQSLFEASIIHQLEKYELPASGKPVLDSIGTIRRGRMNVPFSQREQMSYVCFKELVALSSEQPGFTPEQERIAQAVAPLLVLRLAIPVRAYIADQPLRGRAPQPLSELEELLFCFEQTEKLRLHPSALPHAKTGGAGGERAHLSYLYPLLAKAIKTAGDRWSGAEEVLEPLQETLERLAVF